VTAWGLGNALGPPDRLRLPPRNKRVAASVTKSYAEGIAEMFDEAQRPNPDGERRNIVLVDGDEKQIGYARPRRRSAR